MTDPRHALAALRPEPAVAPDWADSTAGWLCLQRARAAAASGECLPPRPARRWKPLLGVGAAVVLAAGAATAFGFARAPADAAQVLCFRTASIDGDGAGYLLAAATPQAAVDQCASHWTQAWPGDPTPAGFAVCVYPVRPNNAGGAQVVIPLTKPQDATSCQTAGFDPLG